MFDMLHRGLHQRTEKLSQLDSASGAVEERSHQFSSTAGAIAERNATPAQLQALRADRAVRARGMASRDDERKQKFAEKQRQRELRMASLAQQRVPAQEAQHLHHLSVGERGKHLFRSVFHAPEVPEDQQREQEIDDVFAELDGLDIS
jgi:hypothetical protein